MWLYVLLVLLLCVVLYSILIEPNRIRIRRHEVWINKDIPPLMILHLSDFHFYGHQNRRVKFLHELARTPVDLIFITGDLIDDDSGIELALKG